MNQESHESSNSADEGQHQQQQEDEEDEWLLSCRCDSARTIYNLLSCLASVANSSNSSAQHSSYSQAATTTTGDSYSQSRRRRKSSLISGSSSSSTRASLQPVTVFCSPTGLTFHVYGKAKQMQASVDVPAALFTEYTVTSQQQQQQQHENGDADDDADDDDDDWQAGGEFCLNLATVLECLNILGLEGGSSGSSSSSHHSSSHNKSTIQLACSYNLTQEIFKLELLQHDILCTAAIPGMQMPDLSGNASLATAFRSSNAVARLIYQSDSLRQVVSELEYVPGAVVATLSLGKDGLKVAVVGAWGECFVLVPAKGSHLYQWMCRMIIGVELHHRHHHHRIRITCMPCWQVSEDWILRKKHV